MERLTKRIGNSVDFSDEKVGEFLTDHKTGVRALFEKLAYYEDLEEQGLLIELPVAEATTVYMISNNTECCAICKYFCEGYYDCGDECLKLDNRPSFPQYADKPICDKQFLEVIEYTPNLDWIFNNRKLFGKTVFLTRVEAKAKLKKLQSK